MLLDASREGLIRGYPTEVILCFSPRMDSHYRYSNLVLIILLAGTLFAIFAFTERYLESGQYEAEIINRSGAQRMLSQRIALLTSDPDLSNPETFNRKRKEQLGAAIQRMKGNHEFLIQKVIALSQQNEFTTKLNELYFDREHLDERVKAYIAHAESFLLLEEKSPTSREAISRMIQGEAIEGEFLQLLDDAVDLFQAKAEDTLQSFQLALISLFFGAFGLLGVQYWFVFRPINQRLNRTISDLEASNHELTKFAYHVSHDLRAPVLTCKGLVDMAEVAINEGEQELVVESVQHIKESVNRLVALSDKIIALTQRKLGDEVKSSFTVEEIVEEILGAHSAEIEQVGLSVKVDISCEKPIYGKREAFSEALDCLISNAIDYINPRNPPHRLKVIATEKKTRVVISVLDNGLGIPKEQENRLFTMFQKLHPEAAKGSGLGLYVAKQNIGLLGGDIVYVRHEELTEFRISIPV